MNSPISNIFEMMDIFLPVNWNKLFFYVSIQIILCLFCSLITGLYFMNMINRRLNQLEKRCDDIENKECTIIRADDCNIEIKSELLGQHYYSEKKDKLINNHETHAPSDDVDKEEFCIGGESDNVENKECNMIIAGDCKKEISSDFLGQNDDRENEIKIKINYESHTSSDKVYKEEVYIVGESDNIENKECNWIGAGDCKKEISSKFIELTGDSENEFILKINQESLASSDEVGKDEVCIQGECNNVENKEYNIIGAGDCNIEISREFLGHNDDRQDEVKLVTDHETHASSGVVDKEEVCIGGNLDETVGIENVMNYPKDNVLKQNMSSDIFFLNKKNENIDIHIEDTKQDNEYLTKDNIVNDNKISHKELDLETNDLNNDISSFSDNVNDKEYEKIIETSIISRSTMNNNTKYENKNINAISELIDESKISSSVKSILHNKPISIRRSKTKFMAHICAKVDSNYNYKKNENNKRDIKIVNHIDKVDYSNDGKNIHRKYAENKGRVNSMTSKQKIKEDFMKSCKSTCKSNNLKDAASSCRSRMLDYSKKIKNYNVLKNIKKKNTITIKKD